MFNRRVKLNKRQAELVKEMTSLYAEIINQRGNNDRTTDSYRLTFAYSSRIGEIARELGIGREDS